MKEAKSIIRFFKIMTFLLLGIENLNNNNLLAASQKPVSEHLFLQQFNDMCMIAPMINLKLLEQYLKISPKLTNLPESAWLTRRQWLGEADRYLYAWHKSFDHVNKFEENDFKPEKLQEYLRSAIEHGLVTPHFYDKKGDFLFKNITGYRGYFNIPMLAEFA
jgi:hypothetical protein